MKMRPPDAADWFFFYSGEKWQVCRDYLSALHKLQKVWGIISTWYSRVIWIYGKPWNSEQKRSWPWWGKIWTMHRLENSLCTGKIEVNKNVCVYVTCDGKWIRMKRRVQSDSANSYVDEKINQYWCCTPVRFSTYLSPYNTKSSLKRMSSRTARCEIFR